MHAGRAAVSAKVKVATRHVMLSVFGALLPRRLGALRQALAAPSVLGELLLRPPFHRGQLVPALLGHPAHPQPPLEQQHHEHAPSGLLDSILLMAAPKKRTTYRRKRVRRAGQLAQKGPHHKEHVYMCPVCERMRVPHRVCDREDCQTYFRHRWF